MTVAMNRSAAPARWNGTALGAAVAVGVAVAAAPAFEWLTIPARRRSA